ncbi:MAG: DegT/DnrJ/EryC1/StrS family aminotransferase [Candidatus Bathyarchaeota archaeon]|nr:DegT/DnrJ/EryC1/StrS family aminotransferase [Candidatus Bathyarchaeota archaeon]
MKIPLARPVFDKEMENAAVHALQNERFVMGESVLRFEEEFAKFCGTDYAVSVSSGTAALQLSLLAAGLKPGEAAITSPASFIASSNAIIHAQGQPKFADINLQTYTIDPHQIEKAITPKTRALIPVHLYGYPAEMDAINEVAKKHNLPVIEDACQAHGAKYHGKRIGSIGTVGCFSFYPSKNMTVCGDGGMITTNDQKIAEMASKLRDCGRKSQYLHDVIGYTARLNTVSAAIGRVQLKRLDGWNQTRRQVAQAYNDELESIEGLTLPPAPTKEIEPVYHIYVVRTKRRDQLKTHLESQGVSCGVHYALPIHLQPIYQELFGFKEGAYPNAEDLCGTCLTLPMYTDITNSEISFISKQTEGYLKS